MGEIRILVVDDEPGVRQFLKAALEKDAQVTGAASGEEALRLLDRQGFHLVITDQKMPGMSGLDLLKKIKSGYPETEVLLLTAYGTIQDAVDALKHGAAEYLTKPLSSPDELRLKVRQILERASLARKVSLLEEEQAAEFPEELIYTDPAMGKAVALCRKVAVEEATVLLMGESGTGKELFARLIHRWSPRKDGPMVTVNCAALSESLMESEIFGHEKGAFTGAQTRRIGRFEAADGGTICLDEVGEVPLHLQSKLLRVLQEKTLERVGSNRVLRVDVRVVAATNRNLRERVENHQFREDLYYRLNVFPIAIPPLRERREDILLLADRFLLEALRRRGRGAIPIEKEAQQVFLHYAWPGNVRELKNLMERLAILSPEGAVQVRHLPPEMKGGETVPTVGTPRLLNEVEKEHILGVLAFTGGNRTEAAKILGISLRSLQYKLKEYGT